MKKTILTLIAVAACTSAFAKGISAPKEYTADQKKELLKIVEMSSNMYGYAKATFDVCATKSQLARYDQVVAQYKGQLGRYSFGKEAQAIFTDKFEAARKDLDSKIKSQSSDSFCKQITPSIEPSIVKLEQAMKAGENAKDPMAQK